MFSVNDRVRKRNYWSGLSTSKIRDPNPNGSVTAINGKWITVRHDEGEGGGVFAETSITFDYLTDDLEHLNPLLRFVAEVSSS